MDNNTSNIFELTTKQVYFFDLDGTIYLGNKLFKGVLELIEVLRAKKKDFFFLSNNSSKSTGDYLKKLNKFNLNITRNNLILSQHPTIEYLKKNNFKNIFLLGTQSLKNEFKQEGFELTEDDPEILVLAFDQELTYERLTKAAYLLQKNDFPYIATHLDNRCPTENGYIPDAGGIAALLYKATEKKPKVFGKPNKEMLLFMLDELMISPNNAAIFGDRLYTDIKMGKEAELTTCCVLSGETTMEMINTSDYKPDFILNGIWELLDEFNKK
ncbi:MAG: HAD-IIA family hydrolase [Candidatus Lokiarchaeota archaeon]|nr:HAD-IIA family hydrolase [Candidatus Lokiarchaeota archaeon]